MHSPTMRYSWRRKWAVGKSHTSNLFPVRYAGTGGWVAVAGLLLLLAVVVDVMEDGSGTDIAVTSSIRLGKERVVSMGAEGGEEQS